MCIVYGARKGSKCPKNSIRGSTGTSANICGKKRPEYYNHVWSYDFVAERLENSTRVRLLVVIDEYTRESLAIDVARDLSGQDVVELLRYLFAVRGCPAYIRSDNGPEFISSVVQKWLMKSGVDTLHIAPGSPWENGYVESFNSRLRRLQSNEFTLELTFSDYFRKSHITFLRIAWRSSSESVGHFSTICCNC